MITRPIIIGLAAMALISLVLWGAWVLESSSSQESAERGNETEFAYKLLPETDDAHSDVLIGCNEDVVETPNAEFAKWKGLEGVPLALPGGPMTVARLNDVTVNGQFKPAQRAAVEVLKRHSPRRIVLVAHTMCLYYDTIAAWNNSLPQVRERQVKDMDVALRLLREWFPQAEISGYMAEEKNRTLFFRPVPQQ